jgi:hypothetical protein
MIQIQRSLPEEQMKTTMTPARSDTKAISTSLPAISTFTSSTNFPSSNIAMPYLKRYTHMSASDFAPLHVPPPHVRGKQYVSPSSLEFYPDFDLVEGIELCDRTKPCPPIVDTTNEERSTGLAMITAREVFTLHPRTHPAARSLSPSSDEVSFGPQSGSIFKACGDSFCTGTPLVGWSRFGWEIPGRHEREHSI